MVPFQKFIFIVVPVGTFQKSKLSQMFKKALNEVKM